MLGVERHFGNVAFLEQLEQQAFDRREDSRHAADDNLFQVSPGEHGADLGVNRLKIHGHHDFRFGIFDLESQLPLSVKRVVVDHDAASFEGAEITNDGIGRVGQAKTDFGAFLNTNLLKAFGGFVDKVSDLCVCVLAAQEIDTGFGSICLNGCIDEFDQRARLKRGIPLHTLRIMFQPGFIIHVRNLGQCPLSCRLSV